mmetsp:Transcript_1375/g.2888  ORF Transcript_1375/g.2888 Transcript_1375/m.2888 type:complete len:242 (+) Transcript_1375:320-1045(+)
MLDRVWWVGRRDMVLYQLHARWPPWSLYRSRRHLQQLVLSHMPGLIIYRHLAYHTLLRGCAPRLPTGADSAADARAVGLADVGAFAGALQPPIACSDAHARAAAHVDPDGGARAAPHLDARAAAHVVPDGGARAASHLDAGASAHVAPDRRAAPFTNVGPDARADRFAVVHSLAGPSADPHPGAVGPALLGAHLPALVPALSNALGTTIGSPLITPHLGTERTTIVRSIAAALALAHKLNG